MPIRAAYVHWPFCQQKCAYCDFVSWPIDPDADIRPAYWQCLHTEIASVGHWSQLQNLNAPLDTVFWGGGTPSLSNPHHLIAVLAALREQFGITEQAEVTFEANPGTVSVENLSILRQAGFNRISLGLQAAQDELLKALGRIHTRQDFIDSVAAAKQAGFTRISADLMLGLPGQTIQDALDSVDLVLSLGIDHVSYYSLIIEPDTPFENQFANHPERLPDEETERLMYHAVREKLGVAGLHSYEISNAAIPGQACRHNLVYWRGEPYYGFGVAAHSYLQGVRRGNTENWPDYRAAYGTPADVTRPVLPFAATVGSDVIDVREAQKEQFLLGLRLTEGVLWADFFERFHTDARELFAREFTSLVSRGLITHDETGVRLTLKGLDWANLAFAEFV